MIDYTLRFPDEATANAVLFIASEEPVFEMIPTGRAALTIWVYQDSAGDSLRTIYELSADDLAEGGAWEGYALASTEKKMEMESRQTGTHTVFQPKYPGHSIDIIGCICKPTGEMLPGEYGDYPEMEPIPGWHVNVRGPEAPELALWRVEVKTPVRVWA